MSDFPALPYPWQQAEWQQLCTQIEADKLPHALLLAGSPGVGKQHLALALAHLLLCHTPREGTPCGKCKGCELNRAGTHPDLMQLVPEEGSRAIKVDQVREVIDQLGKTAQQGGYRVVLLMPAEAMNINAANALLKALEEPAPGTLLVLVSHRPGAVLPTIRSRCQLRLQSTPSEQQVLAWLEPLVAGSGQKATYLLACARGAPLTALALLEGEALEQRNRWLEGLAQVSAEQLSAIELAARWQGDELTDLLAWYLAWLHDLARWQTGASAPLLDELPAGFDQRLRQLAPELLHRYIEKLLVTRRQALSGANPNKQLLLEELLLDWTVLLRASARRVSGQV